MSPLGNALADGPMGIFGGTFDPIHLGHLRTGLELMRAAQLAEIRWIPTGNPGHRDPPRAPTALRLAMVAAAIADQPGFVLDDREVRRAGPAYTVDTLEEIRADFPARPLCLLLGMDAFAGLLGWRRWREVLQLAHLVVATRPGSLAPAKGPLAELLAEREVREPAALRDLAGGRIYLHPVTSLAISSTDLRDLLCAGGDPRYLVAEPVRTIIAESGCYADRKN